MTQVRREEVKTYMERLYCDCGEELVYHPRDGALASNPPRYQHRCSSCGHVVNVRGHTYPRYVYETLPAGGPLPKRH